MPRKVSEAKRKTPPPGTPEYEAWRAKISAGMRRAKIRRRKSGLLTFTQVATKYDLPLGFVRRKADLREMQVVASGYRRYVREAEAERVLG
jgi:hypothetical protein